MRQVVYLARSELVTCKIQKCAPEAAELAAAAAAAETAADAPA